MVQPAAAGEPAGFSRVIFDGRVAAPGDLYVAIRGETHDGHGFCAQAVAAGARGVLVAEDAAEAMRSTLGEGPIILAAADPRAALGQVARFHRRRWGRSRQAGREATDGVPGRGTLVGVTGSTGKTTTKELLRGGAERGGAGARGGRLAQQRDRRAAGAAGAQALSRLRGGRDGHARASATSPTWPIWPSPTWAWWSTPAWLTSGVVGSVEAIARGKGEMFQHLPAHGCAVLPDGDPRLAAHAAAAPRRLSFGEADRRRRAAHRGSSARRPPGTRSRSQPAARGRAPGSRWSATTSPSTPPALWPRRWPWGFRSSVAARGLSAARPPPLRGEIAELAGRHLYIDCYNANPTSMAAALRTVAALRDAGDPGAGDPGAGHPGAG